MKKIYSFLLTLTALLCIGTGSVWGATLAIGSNDTYSIYAPVYCNQADNMFCSQFIYTASELSALEGKQITHLTFSQKVSSSSDWSNVETRIKEVDYANFGTTSGSQAFESMEGVAYLHKGTWNSSTGTTVVLELSEPYVYEGGHLMIDVRKTVTGGGYSTGTSSSTTGRACATYLSTAYTVLYYYSGSSFPTTGTRSFNRPDITFTYEDAAPQTCPKPTITAAAATSSEAASISWTAGGSETAWTLQYKASGDADWTPVALTTSNTTETAGVRSYALSGLTPNTSYQVKLKAVCGVSDESKDASGSFKTPCGVESFPFSEDFTGLTSGNIPACWDNSEGTTTTASYKWVYYNSGHTATPCVRFDSYNNSSNNTNFLKTPSIAVTEAAVVNFYYKNPQGGDFSVYYSIDGGAQTLLASGLTGQSTWKEATYPLPAGAVGHNVVVIFKGTSNWASNDAYIYLDDVEVKAAPSCTKPTEVAGEATAYNQASISWTENNGKTAWKLQYSSDNGENWSDANSGNSISANPYTLTGLTEQTMYIVRVKTVCGVSEESDWSANSSAFTTPCAPETVPYTMNFETTEGCTSAAGSIPPCWKKITSSATYPRVYNYYTKSGSQNLYFYGNTAQYAILPEFAQDVKNFTISFWYRNSYSGVLNVGYMTDPTDASTFVSLTTGDNALATISDYGSAITEVNLSGAAVGAKYIAFKHTGTNTYDVTYIDAVSVTVTPSCLKPTGVAGSNMTANSADISWTEKNGKSAWKLQYTTVNPASATEGDWTDANEGNNITSNPYTLTGLSASTTYYVRVMTDCGSGDESEWSESSNGFKTSCAAITVDADHEWNENFNSQTVDEMPSCWTAAGNTSAVYVKSSSPYLTLSSKALYFSGGSGTQAIAILPDFTTDVNTLQIAFSHVEESSSSSGKIKFGYYKDATFTALKTCDYSTSSSAWKDEAAFPISGVPDGAKLAFGYTPNSSGYSAAIDDITISLYIAPSCADPTNLDVEEASIGTATATATWTAGGTETSWTLQYKTAAVEWTDPSFVEETINTTPSYDFTGLTENTAYNVRVKAICGVGNESEWVELAQPFRTDCANKAVTELAAWTENFESQESGKMPTCWGEVSTYASSAYTEVNASAAKDGSLGLQVYVYGTNTEIALLPVFETEIKNLKISFDYKNQGDNSNYAALEVGYYNGGAFTNVTTLDKTTSFTASGVIEMPKTAPDGARIAFRAAGKKSGYNGSAYIDNISVIRKPACAVPTGLSATATSTGAAVSWTAGDEEEQWSLRYSVKDADSWTTINDITTTNYTLSNSTIFEIGANYEVQVQAYCDNTHQSAWTASANFSPICGAAPSALTVSNRAANSATLTWTGAESAFKLQTSTDNSTWSDVINVNAKTYNLTGLSAGQTYYARVQNACGGAYASTSFTTWCDSKLSLPTNLTSFTAIPTCWEESPAGAVSSFTNNKLCFTGEGEKFLYLPQSSINLNLLSATFSFSGSLEFGYIDAPNGAFHAFASQPTSGVELDLSAEAAAPKYIAIRYNGANSWAQATISAISIRKTPTCLKPGTPSVTPGVGSASISWTAGGSESAWNLQYKLASAAEWTTVAVTANPYALNGLEQGASYKVRVQAACAGEDPSDWSSEASFTTSCAAIDELPFIADFSQALSACWTIHSESSSSYYIPAANTSMNQLKMDGGRNGYSNNVVVLPAIAADLSDAVLSLEYKNGSTGASYAKLEIGYVTDKDDASTFAIIGEAWEQNTSFTEARVALADVTSGKQVALRFAGASSNSDLSIKNLRILEQVTLADNVDNTSTLAGLNGKRVDVTIGRTFTRNYGGNENPEHYNTICLPFSLSAEELAASPIASDDLWAFKYAKVDEATSELQFRIIEADHIEAGVPYFIGFPASEDNIVNPFFKNVTITASVGQKVGDEAVAQLCGIMKPEPFAVGDQTKLFLYTQTNTLYWWNGASASQLNGFRAFFKVNTGGGGSHAPIRFRMAARIVKEEQETHEEQVATGMENATLNEYGVQKVMENGHVIILRNGEKYTLQGQKIQ